MNISCCVVSSREDYSDMGLSQEKVFVIWPGTTLGVWDSSVDPSVVLSLLQGELLSKQNKNPVHTSKVDILQLARTGSQKQNHRSPKARLVFLETFPRTMGFDGLSLCFCFGR